jgi:hypothetical protein
VGHLVGLFHAYVMGLLDLAKYVAVELSDMALMGWIPQKLNLWRTTHASF